MRLFELFSNTVSDKQNVSFLMDRRRPQAAIFDNVTHGLNQLLHCISMQLDVDVEGQKKDFLFLLHDDTKLNFLTWKKQQKSDFCITVPLLSSRSLITGAERD